MFKEFVKDLDKLIVVLQSANRRISGTGALITITTRRLRTLKEEAIKRKESINVLPEDHLQAMIKSIRTPVFNFIAVLDKDKDIILIKGKEVIKAIEKVTKRL